MTRRVTVLLLAAPVVLTACSGGSTVPEGTPSPSPPSPSRSLDVHPAVTAAKKAGCPNPVRQADKIPFVQEAVDCRAWKGAESYVSFYAFGSNQGRDAWLQVAANFGDLGVIKADRLAVEIPDDMPDLDATAARLVDAVGGERVS